MAGHAPVMGAMLNAPVHTLLAPTWANEKKEENKNRSSVRTLVEFLIKNWIWPKILILPFFLQA